MVELRTITKDNLEDVLKLDVFDYQKSYVSSIAHSLAQAYVYRDTAFPFAIYTDEILVGFIMLGFYKKKQQYTLWKLLIDKKYQNQGYGKGAVQKGITYLTDTFGAKEIYVGVSSGNNRAKRLYASIGFKTTGFVENDMEEMRYIC
jgi:diamine N-acetyltransferase